MISEGGARLLARACGSLPDQTKRYWTTLPLSALAPLLGAAACQFSTLGPLLDVMDEPGRAEHRRRRSQPATHARAVSFVLTLEHFVEPGTVVVRAPWKIPKLHAAPAAPTAKRTAPITGDARMP